ncbi:hypothetical protein ACFWNL_18230 [Kitasatospora sp. NPDC058397]|uniref:hypothetical protein n=1 Tax=unclassified Kitasatospora TaxID=2633591 RepID=UPI00364B7922
MSIQPPVPPCSEPVAIRREVLELLAMVDLTRTGRRVLDILIAYMEEKTGVARLSQDQMCAILGTSKPAVNRGFKELREIGLAWGIEDAVYQLHPLITDGRVASGLAAVPKIKVPSVEEVGEQRRLRYAAQLASLGLSA